jgi:hypothetical protein
MVVPENSIGIDPVNVEKDCSALALRSSRAAQLPLCTMSLSTKIVLGGPPPQPDGAVPLCIVSKVRIDSSSRPTPAFWLSPGTVSAAHTKAADSRQRIGRL